MKAATKKLLTFAQLYIISIHAAREGGDEKCTEFAEAAFKFQSTPPVKAATCLLCVFSVLCYISIHAAREGGDLDREINF